MISFTTGFEFFADFFIEIEELITSAADSRCELDALARELIKASSFNANTLVRPIVKFSVWILAAVSQSIAALVELVEEVSEVDACLSSDRYAFVLAIVPFEALQRVAFDDGLAA